MRALFIQTNIVNNAIFNSTSFENFLDLILFNKIEISWILEKKY